MARKKSNEDQGESNTATAEQSLPSPNDHSQEPITREPGDEAGEPERKKWAPAPDPLSSRSMGATNNSVHLLKSYKDKAYLIRFDDNPNLGREEGDPHPVLAYLKSEGFRWAESQADGDRAWGKSWAEGHFSYPEYLEARRVMQKAAEMMGAKVEQGPAPF